MKKIAVVGAGIYGITIALRLSKNHHVDLYEKLDDILMAASGSNQFRLHRGYHYPRSDKTIIEALTSAPKFTQEYKETIMNGIDHYYCISKEDSLTSAENYVKTLKKHDLEYKEEMPEFILSNAVSLSIRVKENLINIQKLKDICKDRILESNINLLLNSEFDSKMIGKYDNVISCTYTNNNFVYSEERDKRDYQYELCEKILIKLPDRFSRKSVVIMDGPFMCIDPFCETEYHLSGNVVHAIHENNVGHYPKMSDKFSNIINKGIIKKPPVTNFKSFIASATKFFDGIEEAEHIGSMYTFRTVLPHKDKTDERLSILEKVNDKVYTVFAGKIASAVEVADQLSDSI